MIRPHEVDRAHAWFERNGDAAVFFSRMIPVVRTFISVPAGVARMNFAKFTLYTVLGCLPWTLALAWIGYVLGGHWAAAERVIGPVRMGDRRRHHRGWRVVGEQEVASGSRGVRGVGSGARRRALTARIARYLAKIAGPQEVGRFGSSSLTRSDTQGLEQGRGSMVVLETAARAS